MYIRNDGTENAEMANIDVQDESSGTKYVWYNLVSANRGSKIIPIGETEVFEWDILKADAPWDFLLPESTYVITENSQECYCQQTVVAPSMYSIARAMKTR
jgi:hypothetical protein